MVVDKAGDSMLRGHCRLGRPHLRQSQVVEAQLARKAWMLVARERRARLDDVVPLSEPASPPSIILGDGMKLRQVEGQCIDLASRSAQLCHGRPSLTAGPQITPVSGAVNTRTPPDISGAH